MKPFRRINSIGNELRWYHRKENWWILSGFLIAMFAMSIPFILLYIANVSPLELLDQRSDIQGENGDVNYLSLFASMGDFLGGTTVGLLSLASIIFVTAAIVMQKEELELQRKEITATRKEYEITNATMKTQQFDSTFFKMIDLHQKILRDIQYKEEAGKDAIKAFMELITNNIIFGKMDNPTLEYKKEVFNSFYDDFEIYLGHYFRNLYHIIELIYGIEFYSDKEKNLKEQNKYISIFRAQLSSIELTFIFYNVVYSDEKGKEFKGLLKGKDFFSKFINDKDLIWGDDKKYAADTLKI